MLFKLAVRNIKKSVKDFSIYFFTLVLGVTLFYLFNSMENSAGVLSLSGSKMEIITTLSRLLGYVSVFVSIILGCLIVYASRFLMKRRSGEFGTYLLLGMSRMSVTGVLLMETLLIGCLSFIIGIIAGIFGAQFMTLVVCHIFEADMENYRFAFSIDAVVKTLVFFGITYLIVIVFQAAAVAKSRLIHLLNVSKKTETIKVRNLWMSMILFLISIVILGLAYFIALDNNPDLRLIQRAAWGIFLGCIGTFLFMYSFCGMLLKLLQSRKGIYLKDLNMFIGRQLNAQINTMIISMSIIALMLFFSIGIFSAGLSMNSAMTANLRQRVPVDFNINMGNMDISGDVDADTKMRSQTSIIDFLNDYGYQIENQLKEYEEVMIRYTGDPNEGNAIGISHFSGGNLEGVVDYSLSAMGVSDYNRLAKSYHLKPAKLGEEEYIIIGNIKKTTNILNRGLAEGVTVTIQKRTLKPALSECQYGFINMDTSNDEAGILIIPDSLAADLPVKERVLSGNFKTTDEAGISASYRQIMEAFHTAEADGYWNNGGGSYWTCTRQEMYEASIGMGTIVIFIGIYLGIIFIITSAAVLALKQLSESSDNRNRYAVLRKIGTDERMINKSLFIQIGAFFGLPLIIALIHSYFGLKFTERVLQDVGDEDMLNSVGITALVIILIYGGYFLITYLCSKSMIRKEES